MAVAGIRIIIQTLVNKKPTGSGNKVGGGNKSVEHALCLKKGTDTFGEL
jgi:hypothetical protein